MQKQLPDGVLDLDGACRFLGCSRVSLYRLTSRREIRHYKCLGRLRFKEEDLAEFMFKNRIATTDELGERAAKIGREMR